MKVMTILGTRPEIIRLSRIVERLDQLCDQVLVHTGQNYDRNLNDIFFEELGVRAPQHYLGARGSFGEQMGAIFAGCEKVMTQEKPDRFLVLGDTNSSLGALIAKRLGIPVFHMEAGNRCYDDRVPEEVNRRVIDHSTDVWLPYTERSRQNLLREGIPGNRVFVTGNPIFEVIRHYESAIAQSKIFSKLNVAAKKYFLVTMHRAENVDVEARLRGITAGLDQIASDYKLPVIVSTHPRTRARMETFRVANANPLVRFMDPFGFFDFISLEKNALCVLSDSGTVQEEACIFQVPSVTIRDTTERPETLEHGCNVLSGADPATIVMCVKKMLERKSPGVAPLEYLVKNVSETVTNLVLGFQQQALPAAR